MSTKIAAVVLSCIPLFTASAQAAEPQKAGPGDPIEQLTGDWALDGFVVGVAGGKPSLVGVGGFSGPTCGGVTVAHSSDRTVSLAASCETAGDYSFRLSRGPDPHMYLLTVKSKHGISVDEFPVSYVEGKGWQGVHNQLVDGETVSITAAITLIEGRNWRGWRIQVLPPAAVLKDAKPEDLKKPYFMADLTRRK